LNTRREQIDESAYIWLQATYKTKTGRKVTAMMMVADPSMLRIEAGRKIVFDDLRETAERVIREVPPPSKKRKARNKA
jgi:hypothetical protein